jgi:hypothetical protein
MAVMELTEFENDIGKGIEHIWQICIQHKILVKKTD